MGIEAKSGALKGIIRQHADEMGVKLTRGDETVAITAAGDVSCEKGNIVLQGDEALVREGDALKLLRLEGGRVVGGLFVDASGAERDLTPEEMAASAPLVESALACCARAVEHPEEFEVKGLFEE